MRRTGFVLLALTLLLAIPAGAQERTGAGRVDVTLAPVGGRFFTDSSTGNEPNFETYMLAGAATFNLTPRFAIEGEFGSAVGLHQDMERADGVVFADQSSPCLFQYTANLIVHPTGSNHALAPYAVGGIGGMTLIGTDEVRTLGISRNVTYLTGNVGGGLKWFARRHWGVRADYRLIAVQDKATAPEFFGREEVRYGHRVYGGLLLNY